MSREPVSEAVRRLFEDARKRKGAPVEEERFLAYLTDPPAPTGRRVADTFAGRFRFVRFMESVQLEFGICFSNQEWERGVSLDQFATLVAAKAAEPGSARRLADKRLIEAQRRRTSDPLKFGLFASPALVVAMFSPSWTLKVLFALSWALVVGVVTVVVLKDVRYAGRLVARTARQP